MSERTTSIDSAWLRLGLLAAAAVVFVRTAWLCDDAYITLRTVSNFVAGFGPRFNVAERVQAFTHPLWFLLETPFFALSQESFYTPIALSLVVLSLVTLAMLTATSVGSFWVLATIVGVFVGPAQAASRSYMARIAPPGLEAEMFGLFALSGKATAFAGPWMVSLVTTAFASQRYGMAVIPVFLLLGLGLLLTVKR